MPRQSNPVMDDLIPGYGKIRKRGCSSSPSSSSKVHNYRFKRAIMVGKTRVGGGSRSSTPAPSWRMTPSSRSKLVGGGGVESPNYEGGGGGGGSRSRPVSARKLAATLWEMNEMPSPQNLEMARRRREMETTRVREKTNPPVHTPGSHPSHLSDPSHSPVSERMNRSGSGSHHRISSSQRPRLEDNNGEVFDSLSSNCLMEIETRSRAQTPSGSVDGVKPPLKDVSNALTTSKELLKIIHQMWAHDNLPSSSMSLISALHAELERARLQVNQFIKRQRSDQIDVNYLLKCFAEEKASWRSKERRAIEAAIESVAGELEVERKLRRRCESLNKKLGRELAETKASFAKALKELESEKRAREIMEQVCDELAVDIGEDRAEAEELKRESIKVHEEVEREREMLQLADKLREERVQMKLVEAKHQFEEKNALVDKLRNQLEAFLGNRVGGKKKGPKDKDLVTNSNRSNLGGTHQNEEHDDGEVEDGDGDGDGDGEDSADSDLHSIELNMDNNNRSFKWTHAHHSKRDSVEDDIKWRNLVNGRGSRKSTSSIQRNISEENLIELEKQTARRSHGDELQRYKSVKGLRDQIFTNPKAGSVRDLPSPRVSRNLDDAIVQERPPVAHGRGLNSRTAEARAETFIGRRSKK